MFKITQSQQVQVLNILVESNVPVQAYKFIQDMFSKLPPVEEKKDDKKEV